MSSVGCALQGFSPCRGKISREHYISEGVLKRIFGAPAAEIAGLAWLHGQTKVLPTTALTGKFFCEGHNNGLSNLDSTALRFVEAIQDGSRAIHGGSKKCRTHTFDGDKFELWLLKVAFGLWETGGFAQGGKALGGLRPDQWKRIIAKQEKFPEGWGAYFEMPTDPITINENMLSIQPLSNDKQEVLAIKLRLCNVPISFIMGKPDHPESWGVRNPPQIQFSNRDAAWTLRLKWDNPSGAKGIHFQHLYGSV